MQLSNVLVILLFTSSALSIAIPEADDTSADISTTDSTADEQLEGGLPDFDRRNLDAVDLTEREIDELEDVEDEALEKRAGTKGAAIVACAKKLEGTEYVYGGCKPNPPFGPDPGLDCSCLSRTCVYKGTKKVIPRTTQTQYPYKGCKQLPRGSAQPGDLIFWGCGESGGVHHVGILSKKGYVIHAPHTGTVVQQSPIWTSDGLCPKAVRCW